MNINSPADGDQIAKLQSALDEYCRARQKLDDLFSKRIIDLRRAPELGDWSNLSLAEVHELSGRCADIELELSITFRELIPAAFARLVECAVFYPDTQELFERAQAAHKNALAWHQTHNWNFYFSEAKPLVDKVIAYENSDWAYREAIGLMDEAAKVLAQAPNEPIQIEAAIPKEIIDEAEKGDGVSQYLLGKLYYQGDGWLPDYQKAKKWFLLAAKQGVPMAQVMIGDMYCQGKGLPKDYREAKKWYSQVDHYAPAQFKLGMLYFNGDGVPRDYQEAVKWFLMAAKPGDQFPWEPKGHAEAQYILGVLYLNEDGIFEGISQDYQQAARWFRMAAKQGAASAQFKYGLLHYYGHGVAQNYQDAIKWLRKAAVKRHAKAQYYLGLMYSQGQGVPHDNQEASKWFRLAAGKGCADAQWELGRSYATGEGVLKDEGEAVKWWRKAAMLNHVKAKDELHRMGHTERIMNDDVIDMLSAVTIQAQELINKHNNYVEHPLTYNEWKNEMFLKNLGGDENTSYIFNRWGISRDEISNLYLMFNRAVKMLDKEEAYKEILIHYLPNIVTDNKEDYHFNYLDAIRNVALDINHILQNSSPYLVSIRSGLLKDKLNYHIPKVGGFCSSFTGLCPQCMLDNRSVLIRQSGAERGECPECHLVLEFHCPRVILRSYRGNSNLQDRPAIWLISPLIRDCIMMESDQKSDLNSKEDLKSYIDNIV